MHALRSIDQPTSPNRLHQITDQSMVNSISQEHHQRSPLHQIDRTQTISSAALHTTHRSPNITAPGCVDDSDKSLGGLYGEFLGDERCSAAGISLPLEAQQEHR
jgi:hypothetical protein